MRVLIIEDDRHKEEDLQACISELEVASEIRTKRSYNSGVNEALGWRPDIIVLDMSMPLFDARDQVADIPNRSFAGRDILLELARKRIGSKVIVVTQYDVFGGKEDRMTLDELKAQLKIQFPINYVATVYYHVSQSAWRGELKAAIEELKSG